MATRLIVASTLALFATPAPAVDFGAFAKGFADGMSAAQQRRLRESQMPRPVGEPQPPPVPQPLRGLRDFSILISDRSPQPNQCGIGQGDLDTSLRFIIGQSRIKIVPAESSQAQIFAEFFASSESGIGSLCFASFRITVLTRATIDATKRDDVVMIWDRMQPIGTAKDTVPNFETAAKQLVNDWNAANP